MTLRWHCGVIAILVCAHPVLSAQAPGTAGGPPAEAIRLGIFWVEPRFRLTNIGVDTNVFNDAANPQRDVTATAATGTNVWLRTGRGLLTLSGNSEFVYFDKFSSERSFSSHATAGLRLPF